MVNANFSHFRKLPMHLINAAKACLPSLVFVTRASYRRLRNNDVMSHEVHEVTMTLRQVLRTVALFA